jgi:hypothetical protein
VRLQEVRLQEARLQEARLQEVRLRAVLRGVSQRAVTPPAGPHWDPDRAAKERWHGRNCRRPSLRLTFHCRKRQPER